MTVPAPSSPIAQSDGLELDGNQSAEQGSRVVMPASTTTAGVVLTPAAVRKVWDLLEQEGRDGLRLRLAVQPGGCSGMRYQLFFDDRLLDGDERFAFPVDPEPAHTDDTGTHSGCESGNDE